LESYNFDEYYLVNNAASLGEILSVRNITSTTGIISYIDFTITQPIIFTHHFLQYYHKKYDESKIKSTQITGIIINISSLAAVQPNICLSFYCTSKAACDMFFATVAKEEETFGLKTINYAPGPCDTDIINGFNNCFEEVPLGVILKSMKEKGQLIVPEVTANKLADVLIINTFITGTHIDFYDLK